MNGRVKEDIKKEKTIRDISKLPANRHCINCNSLGPQYVCTSFWTFVCATCSGIHREFTHRVKSISMATFTPEEIMGLNGGGNKCAKEVYLKEWDWEHQYLPDDRNIEGLRKFIKHVYVDKRYAGEIKKSTVEREDCSRYSEISNERDSGNSLHGEISDRGRMISAYFEEVDEKFRDIISETAISSNTDWSPNYHTKHNVQKRQSTQYQALMDSSKPRSDQVRSLRGVLDRMKRKDLQVQQYSPKSIPKPTSSPNYGTHEENRLRASSSAKNMDSLVPVIDMENMAIKSSSGGVLLKKLLSMPRTSGNNSDVSPASPLTNVLPSSSNSPKKKTALKGDGSDPAVIPKSSHLEPKSSGRKELVQPQHLFATTNASSATGQSPTAMLSSNSIASWDGTKPNMLEGKSLLRSSTFGTSYTQWVPFPAHSSSSTSGTPFTSARGNPFA